MRSSRKRGVSTSSSSMPASTATGRRSTSSSRRSGTSPTPINLRGSYLTIHFTVPHLKAAGGGNIVLISSINGTRVFTTGGATAYTATKAAQAAMASQLAVELARFKIRVNAVCPGQTRTNIRESTWIRNREGAAWPITYPEGDIPLTGKIGAEPTDIADAIRFLCSSEAR